ncbi:MAG: Trk family potassium uptake protein [Solobacterium sp.]|nr:Trk family potassium uptake protein [Solobacterium sp.]
MWTRIQVFFREHFTTFRAIILGFVLLIAAGAILLCLPFAAADGQAVSFVDALFTSTSASCVTGLVLFETGVKWSLFGKIVILVLIQIGGLGVVTAVVAAQVLRGKRIGIVSRLTMQDAVSAPQTGGIIRFMLFFLNVTLLIEGIGALLLSFVFMREFGFLKGAGYAVFHSVSAFCNAGFDILGTSESFASLAAYRSSVLVNLVIILLIVIGGLGFTTWRDLLDCHFHLKKLRLQSKIILSMTVILITLPFLFFYFLEFAEAQGSERVLAALFQAVTPRTAGFSTVDYGKMSEPSLLLSIVLMMTGGAPGSTAGGFKVTTLAVIILSARAVTKKNTDAVCFRRRLDEETIHRAAALVTVYVLLLLAGTLILSISEQLPVLACMFECASALGTVGLTTGITPGLHTLGKLLLCVFMFFGRAGGLTISYAIVIGHNRTPRRYPPEKVTVG